MVTKRVFGKTKDGAAVDAYTITNENGIAVTVLNYGATLQSVVLPCKGGPLDVVLGYDSVGEYERNDGYLGASVGRYAGRVPNALLYLNGTVFPLSENEGSNHLHGGKRGFDKRIWKAETGRNRVAFSLLSEDCEEGYPGTVLCAAVYSLDGDTLSITYRGKTDLMTAWNPTNHAYWNLNGHGSGDARTHRLQIPADRFVPVGSDMLPTDGEADVSGTRFDFRYLRTIDGAYDHCFVLSGSTIRLFGNRGIGMEIATDCKAVQLYTANFLTPRKCKGGADYGLYGAICLETEGRQAFKTAPIPEESVLRPGAVLSRTTAFRFITEEG